MAKVLVIEDNAANLKLAEFVLAQAGHEVLKAVDAIAGLALAREALPDLVLMDIQLPGIDGVTALERMRRDPSTSRIPVVAMTASVMKEDRERFDKAGFDGFITKPIDVRAFPGQVRDAIAKGTA